MLRVTTRIAVSTALMFAAACADEGDGAAPPEESVGTTASALALSNGGFESPAATASPYHIGNMTADWTFASAGVARAGSGFMTSRTPAEGAQVAWLQRTGSVTQTMSVTAAEAGTYNVRFKVITRSYQATAANNFVVQLDGVAVGSAITPTGSWVQHSRTINLTGTHALKIQALNTLGSATTDDNTVLIDDVQIQRTTATEPSSLSGLAAWYDGGDAAQLMTSAACTGQASDGQGVLCWKDKSSHARHMTSGTQVATKTAGGGLTFSALGHLQSSYQPTATEDLTVFVVVESTGAQTSGGSALRPILLSGDPALGNGKFDITASRTGSGDAALSIHGHGFTDSWPYSTLTANGFAAGVPVVVAMRLDASPGNHSLIGRLNGAQTMSVTGTNNAPALGNLQLGGSSTDATRRFTGRVREVVIYNRALSTSEIQGVEGYLNVKWRGPTTVANLTGWYDGLDPTQLMTAAACTGQASDGQGVLCWKDKSTHARHMTSAAQVATKSGGGGLAFTAAGHMQSTYQPAATDDLTVFAVVESTGAQTSGGSALRPILLSGDPGLGNGKLDLTASRAGSNDAALGFHGHGYSDSWPYTSLTAGAFFPGAPVVVALRLDASPGNHALVGRVNGSQTMSQTGANDAPALGPFQLGGSSTDATRRFTGAVREIAIYDRALSPAEIERIEAYLAAKYGLTLGDVTGPTETACSNGTDDDQDGFEDCDDPDCQANASCAPTTPPADPAPGAEPPDTNAPDSAAIAGETKWAAAYPNYPSLTSHSTTLKLSQMRYLKDLENGAPPPERFFAPPGAGLPAFVTGMGDFVFSLNIGGLELMYHSGYAGAYFLPSMPGFIPVGSGFTDVLVGTWSATENGSSLLRYVDGRYFETFTMSGCGSQPCGNRVSNMRSKVQATRATNQYTVTITYPDGTKADYQQFVQTPANGEKVYYRLVREWAPRAANDWYQTAEYNYTPDGLPNYQRAGPTDATGNGLDDVLVFVWNEQLGYRRCLEGIVDADGRYWPINRLGDCEGNGFPMPPTAVQYPAPSTATYVELGYSPLNFVNAVRYPGRGGLEVIYATPGTAPAAQLAEGGNVLASCGRQTVLVPKHELSTVDTTNATAMQNALGPKCTAVGGAYAGWSYAAPLVQYARTSAGDEWFLAYLHESGLPLTGSRNTLWVQHGIFGGSKDQPTRTLLIDAPAASAPHATYAAVAYPYASYDAAQSRWSLGTAAFDAQGMMTSLTQKACAASVTTPTCSSQTACDCTNAASALSVTSNLVSTKLFGVRNSTTTATAFGQTVSCATTTWTGETLMTQTDTCAGSAKVELSFDATTHLPLVEKTLKGTLEVARTVSAYNAGSNTLASVHQYDGGSASATNWTIYTRDTARPYLVTKVDDRLGTQLAVTQFDALGNPLAWCEAGMGTGAATYHQPTLASSNPDSYSANGQLRWSVTDRFGDMAPKIITTSRDGVNLATQTLGRDALERINSVQSSVLGRAVTNTIGHDGMGRVTSVTSVTQSETLVAQFGREFSHGDDPIMVDLPTAPAPTACDFSSGDGMPFGAVQTCSANAPADLLTLSVCAVSATPTGLLSFGTSQTTAEMNCPLGSHADGDPPGSYPVTQVGNVCASQARTVGMYLSAASYTLGTQAPSTEDYCGGCGDGICFPGRETSASCSQDCQCTPLTLPLSAGLCGEAAAKLANGDLHCVPGDTKYMLSHESTVNWSGADPGLIAWRSYCTHTNRFVKKFACQWCDDGGQIRAQWIDASLGTAEVQSKRASATTHVNKRYGPQHPVHPSAYLSQLAGVNPWWPGYSWNFASSETCYPWASVNASVRPINTVSGSTQICAGTCAPVTMEYLGDTLTTTMQAEPLPQDPVLGNTQAPNVSYTTSTQTTFVATPPVPPQCN